MNKHVTIWAWFSLTIALCLLFVCAYIPDIGYLDLLVLQDEEDQIDGDMSETAVFGDEVTSDGRRPLKNVLFLIVDDLRPQLGAYFDGDNPDYFSKLRIQTPNLDRLADQSAVFRNAYTQYSLCGPSRTSMLTSRRPDVTQVYNNKVYWRQVGGNFSTLPQYFKDNGYVTVGLGKVFHPGKSSGNNDPLSWTEPYYLPVDLDNHHSANGSLQGLMAVDDSVLDQLPLVDMVNTARARHVLRNVSAEAKSGRRPFFLALGFRKPHLGLVCPRSFYDLYPLEDDDFLVDARWRQPKIRRFVHIGGVQQKGDDLVVPPDVLRQFRRAYFACVSYVDSLVGHILRELDELGLSSRTIVCFVGDHGYHLGENGHWGKIAAWEVANRVPFIIRVPGVTDAGLTSYDVVELVDVFPTLVEAAGLPALPTCPTVSSDVTLCTQGVSLMPLLTGSADHLNKTDAYSQVNFASSVIYTLRTKQFRLIQQATILTRQANGRQIRAVDWTPNSTQLYDHIRDPLEQINVANYGSYKDIVSRLSKQLHHFVQSQLY